MALSMRDIIMGSDASASICERLDALSYDKLLEIDLSCNHLRTLYHVHGKYFVQVTDGSYTDLLEHASNHLVHPEDRLAYENLLEYETLGQRLMESDTPGCISAQVRQRLQNGSWCWVEQLVIGGPPSGLPDGIIRLCNFDIHALKDRERGGHSRELELQDCIRDEATGLLRDRDFFTRAQQYITERNPKNWCLVAIDIEFFRILLSHLFQFRPLLYHIGIFSYLKSL